MKKTIFLLLFTFVFFAGCNKEEEPIPQKEGKILVLMYHRIVAGEPTNLYERSINNLEADLKYIIKNNISIISFDDLDSIEASGKMPCNSVILTFDDGDASWFSLVRPLILQYKAKATFFLWTYMMDHDSFLKWDEVRLMSNYMYTDGVRPFTFGSHTYSHQYLLQNKAGFSTAEEYNGYLDYQLGESKKIIEKYTDLKVTALSLPFGDGAGDPTIISAARRNGYKFIRTTNWAAIDKPDMDLFELPGLPMLDSTEPDFIGTYLK